MIPLYISSASPLSILIYPPLFSLIQEVISWYLLDSPHSPPHPPFYHLSDASEPGQLTIQRLHSIFFLIKESLYEIW